MGLEAATKVIGGTTMKNPFHLITVILALGTQAFMAWAQ
jgi:hypothetical protein